MAFSEAEFEALRDRMESNRRGGDANCLNTHLALQEGLSKSAPVARKARAASKRGMNKWEGEYAQELEVARQTGLILWWAYEPIRLRLADNTGYTPDFCELFPSGLLRFTEIKGFLRDDANVKFKMAAGLYPFDFVMLRKQKVKDGGGWLCIKHLNNRKGIQ